MPRARATLVVMALGEDAMQSGEGRSQVDIGLKGLQDELLKAVLEVNKNVVVVLMNGRPLAIALDGRATCRRSCEAWFPGSQAGHAVADVLFGDYNPSGKLPVSFPRHVGQLPVSYSHKNTGRPGPALGRVLVALRRRAERGALPVRFRPELHDVRVRCAS